MGIGAFPSKMTLTAPIPGTKKVRDLEEQNALLHSHLESLDKQKEDRLKQLASGYPFKRESSFFDNLLVRIHFIIVMIRWTGLAPWEF